MIRGRCSEGIELNTENIVYCYMLSVKKTQHGNEVDFQENYATILRDNEVIATTVSKRNVYIEL